MRIGDKIIGFRKLNNTYFMHIHYNSNITKSFVLQFSRRRMWLRPHSEYIQGFKMWGWLFLYLGYNITEI